MDEPLAYQPAHGPRISFKLYNCAEVINDIYRYSYYTLYLLTGEFGVNNNSWLSLLANNWYCSWFSCMIPDNVDVDTIDSVALLAPGGGVRIYTNFDGTVPEFGTNTRLLVETNNNGLVGFRLLYPSGAEDVYEAACQPSWFFGDPVFFRSQQIDARGGATTFVYTTNADGALLLQYVIDGDGKTNTLTYTNIVNWYTNFGKVYILSKMDVISTITDPYGRTATFLYNCSNNLDVSAYGELTNIVDVAGISSSFAYDSSLTLTQLTTPYGSTSFYFAEPEFSRLTVVTEPDNSHQMFFYCGHGLNNDAPTFIPMPAMCLPTGRRQCAGHQHAR